ncbi:hypothetical protein ACFFRR_007274 [Megaselia abdita]
MQDRLYNHEQIKNIFIKNKKTVKRSLAWKLEARILDPEISGNQVESCLEPESPVFFEENHLINKIVEIDESAQEKQLDRPALREINNTATKIIRTKAQLKCFDEGAMKGDDQIKFKTKAALKSFKETKQKKLKFFIRLPIKKKQTKTNNNK